MSFSRQVTTLLVVRDLSSSVPSDTWETSGREGFTFSETSLLERLCQILASVSVFPLFVAPWVLFPPMHRLRPKIRSFQVSASVKMRWLPDVSH